MIVAVLIGLILAVIVYVVLAAIHLGVWAAVAALVVFLLVVAGSVYNGRGGPVV